MAGPSRKKSDKPSAGRAEAPVPLPADVDLGTLYGAPGSAALPELDDAFDDLGAEEDGELVIVPPVRLLDRAELAATALRVPLFDRAIRLARWIAPMRPVDQWGELGAELEALAAVELGLGAGDTGVGEVAQAWSLAVDLELIEVSDAAEGEGEPGSEVARPGAALEELAGGDPDVVLEAWETATSIVAGTTVEADFEPGGTEGPGAGEPEGGPAEDSGPGSAEAGEEAEEADLEESEEEYAQLEEAREQAQALLDDALQVLYEASAFADTQAGETIPLGVLAALLVVPDGEEPTEEMLGDITAVMVALDPMLQDLADIGMLDYSPIDPSLFEEAEGDAGDGGEAGSAALLLPTEPFDPEAPVDATEAARFGLARLTPLGVHGVRQWLLDEGYDAPLIGDHAQGTGAELLTGICESANVLPEEEIKVWLEGRDPVAAAAELLAAADGNDLVAPIRRLFCTLALELLGEPAAPAVREVLGDPYLTGLATAWLNEQAGADLAAPERPVVLWTTVDALAARLIDSGAEDEHFRELVVALTSDQPAAPLFAELWRVDHPYTTAVLDAVGEQHPDKATAKEARKAAYKARSRAGSQRG
ncbi:hypothetical protein [Streptacidiphilus sp. EB129]|uniref:hypothetical protein n=1 Tax=Streptacidiphilus sp. EB129 TaxID=3156262 RepID=UPI003512CA69